MKELKWTFDKAVDLYEKYRACYVEELYKDIFSFKPINKTSHLIEVGIGTGHATKPFLETGASIHAVEYGVNLSKFCKKKFKHYPNITVYNVKFEDFEQKNNSTDLVYSASAFHWIPEVIGYTKVYSMLKSNGAFARFANHPYPDKEKPDMCEYIQKIYKAYAPYRGGRYSPPVEYTEEFSRDRAKIAEKYGFYDIQYKIYYHTRTFTADEYIGLLGTYSDNIAMEESIRKEFFKDIHQVILDYGNEITIYDTLDLQLARKP